MGLPSLAYRVFVICLPRSRAALTAEQTTKRQQAVTGSQATIHSPTEGPGSRIPSTYAGGRVGGRGGREGKGEHDACRRRGQGAPPPHHHKRTETPAPRRPSRPRTPHPTQQPPQNMDSALRQPTPAHPSPAAGPAKKEQMIDGAYTRPTPASKARPPPDRNVLATGLASSGLVVGGGVAPPRWSATAMGGSGTLRRGGDGSRASRKHARRYIMSRSCTTHACPQGGGGEPHTRRSGCRKEWHYR
jgi:hypothetical protein